MKSIHQTYRRRLRAAFGVLLMLLSGMILELAVAQYISSSKTVAAVQDAFSIIATPTDEYRFFRNYDKATGQHYFEDCPNIYEEAYDFICALPDTAPEYVVGLSKSSLAAGACLSMELINPDLFGLPAFTSIPTEPTQNLAILSCTITEEPSYTFARNGNVDTIDFVNLQAQIDEVFVLPRGYADPTGMRVLLTFELPLEKYANLELRQGGQYLVMGDYRDLDMYIREQIARNLGFLEPEDIDWSNLREELNPSWENAAYYQAKDLRGNVRRVAMSEYDLTWVRCTSLTLSVYAPMLFAQVPPGATARELLDTADWAETVRRTQAYMHTFPILAAENIDHMVAFAAQKAHVTQGRKITREEYEAGSPVCLISESLAQANGLEVGDTIPVSLFPKSDKNHLGAPLKPEQMKYPGNHVSPTNPRIPQIEATPEAAQEVTYTIVGLYRQKEEWSREHGSFTPNTILVPAASVKVRTMERIDGALGTVKIRHGKLPEFQEYLKDQGYEGLFDYYQRDFGTIEGSISGYERISQMVLMVGLALWLLILALFMLLFPAQEGKNLNRMWALGAEKKQLMGHVILGSGSVLLPGAVLGFIGSALAAEKFGQIVAQLAKSEEPLKISISSLAAASTVSFLVQLLILAIIAFFMSRKRREDF